MVTTGCWAAAGLSRLVMVRPLKRVDISLLCVAQGAVIGQVWAKKFSALASRPGEYYKSVP